LDANPAAIQMLGFESVEAFLLLGNTVKLYCKRSKRDEIAKRYEENDRGEDIVEWKRKDAKIIAVRLIGRQHGGFLHVYGEVGIGTTFRIDLPVTPTREKAAAPILDLRPARGGKETILIAEDHLGLREKPWRT
jgi:hypothetical protein